MEALADVYFLRELTSREREKVNEICVTRQVEAGTTILTVNQDVTELYVIGSGHVRVVVPVEEGAGADEDVLVSLGPGECFGEFSFVDRAPTSSAVVADEPTVLFALPHADLDALLESDRDLALKLTRAMLRSVVERLRSTDAELAMAHYVARYV